MDEYSSERVVEILTAEGHDHADVTAAIDSLIDAGLELDQPEEGRLFSAGELGVLRMQLES